MIRHVDGLMEDLRAHVALDEQAPGGGSNLVATTARSAAVAGRARARGKGEKRAGEWGAERNAACCHSF